MTDKSNIISLDAFKEKKADLVYQCQNCGVQLFFLTYDEFLKKVVVECRGCNSIVRDFEVIDTSELMQ